MVETGSREAALELDGVQPSSRLPAGGGVSLRLRMGEAAAVVGPPGCGKTALLRVAAGLEPPRTGERRSTAERIAIVFQQGGLVRNITLADNLLVPLYYQGLSTAEARDRASQALDLFGLAAVAGERPGAVSNDTRLLAQFARAAALDADLLFVDEAFSQLSRPAAARAERWLGEEVGKGCLAVMMTGVEGQAIPQLPTRILELPGAEAPE
jgi:ABC-type nitrate/sulfonate/bicarbonate transport system ATPase subunit